MAAVGALILLIGGFLSFAMARGISKQTDELQASVGQLRALAARLQSIREEERKKSCARNSRSTGTGFDGYQTGRELVGSRVASRPKKRIKQSAVDFEVGG